MYTTQVVDKLIDIRLATSSFPCQRRPWGEQDLCIMIDMEHPGNTAKHNFPGEREREREKLSNMVARPDQADSRTDRHIEGAGTPPDFHASASLALFPLPFSVGQLDLEAISNRPALHDYGILPNRDGMVAETRKRPSWHSTRSGWRSEGTLGA
ncbi:hypothetical protein BO99DRAFT_263141 [Aspergillus violaceofuscus CBS 115571]|uniref:Uncharacterized protein n=1 Tax=Aspergillus violaceofuscus (strain CBS 115571) TaxID=1450538 RepID=A0A2V5H0E7_ASPV1|nr:hypothetical protein BO99DRAFT_263141 [Aspergillus violaceofuscus CBS 115571]